MGAKVKDSTSVEMHDVNEARPAPEDDKPSSWKDALFGRRARKYAFIFIVAFLAVLTVKDVFDLVNSVFVLITSHYHINLREYFSRF